MTGIGLSDWAGYADLLKQKFKYTNTFFHKSPQLDISNPDPRLHGTCDFLISSDVFEHVLPPVSKAFLGAARLLKRGGLFVMTVPFVPNARTREHYPDAVGYEVNDSARVTIETKGGHYFAENPVFHGGPGSTLEMRLFGAIDLERELQSADFCDVTFHAESCLSAGVLHSDLYSVPITARKA